MREKKEATKKTKVSPENKGLGLLPLESPRRWTHSLLFATTAALLFLGIQCFRFPEVYLEGQIYFLDPDSYSWLERAEQVLNESRIFVHHDPDDNYPIGYTSHWTQPFHWMLALFALVFRFFGAGTQALEWAGLWICPIFGALTAGMLATWAFRRWPWFLSSLTVGVFMANPFEHWTFSLGRPDHQCLLIFLLMGSTLLLLGSLRPPEQRMKPLVASAVLTAAGIWISVQALSLWALLLGVLIWRTALARKMERTDPLKKAFSFSVFAAASLLLFLILEKRGDFFLIEADALSLGQVILVAMPALGLFLTGRLGRRIGAISPIPWFFSVLLAPLLLTSAVSTWLWFHQEGAFPPGTLDAMARWFSANAEFLPTLFMVEGKMGLGRFHEVFGSTFYALPILVYGLARCRLLGAQGKWILSVGITLASLLALWQMRWRDLHALFIAPVFAAALCYWIPTLLPGLGKGRAGKGGTSPIPILVSLAAGLVLLIPWILETGAAFSSPRKPPPDYQILRHICTWIRAQDPLAEGGEGRFKKEREAVLAPWDQGPMVKYWSGRPVVAGPYHRNMAGILDTMNAYTARTQEAFDAIALKRRIRYVLRPPLGDPLYDTYTYEWIAGVAQPSMVIASEHMTSDHKRVLRGYNLNTGMTAEKIDTLLRFRLENNVWKGWTHLKPVFVPGLEALVQDAGVFPYLYRYENPEGG